jgi:sirohydrochlorin cobaltochelatase
MSQISLVLAGHGSHISPNTAGIVWRYVDQLRRWGVADEITACFWKEEPFFNHALDTVTADTIVIVPVFTAQGYFTQTVIPSEMGLDGAITYKNGKSIHYTPTIGEHPYLSTIVQERVTDTLANENLNPDDTAVTVIGHGTRRNKSSRDATRHQANLIRKGNFVAEVVDVYLDDDPDIQSLYQSTSAKNVIAIPYFLAEGSHVTIDVPDALGIEYGNYPDTVNSRTVFYTPPIGTDDAICRVILELARDTGLPFDCDDIHNIWSGFPKVGHNEFMRVIESSESLEFGQVVIADKKIRHVNKTNNTPSALSSPEALRVFMREDPFRPLPTSDDLPLDFHVEFESADQAYAVIETIYPTAIADWANLKNNSFVTESLEDIGTRQLGLFKDIHLLEPTMIPDTVDKVCGRCMRQPSWLNGHQSDNPKLPCKSACNTWLSTAKARATGANNDEEQMISDNMVHLSKTGDTQQ